MNLGPGQFVTINIIDMEEENRFNSVIEQIDAYNSKDPNIERIHGSTYPKELLYGQRMFDFMKLFIGQDDELMLIAARAQHIGRWEIPRDKYPMNKVGYLKWRNELAKHHIHIIAGILEQNGYSTVEIEKISQALSKSKRKTEPKAQTMEDVACLVFLEYYALDFAKKNTDKDIPEILRKVLNKMSDKGKNAIQAFCNKEIVEIVNQVP